MRLLFRPIALLVALLVAPLRLPAGSAEEDWGKVTALDAGPQVQPRTEAEARAAAVAHLARQEQAVRAFLAAHPGEARGFEARLRLARLLHLRADVAGDEKSIAEAGRLLDALEERATPEQRAEVDFARISQLMRTLRKPTPQQRDRLLAATRQFQQTHPADRRLAALLAEVAGLFTLQPKTMRALLTDAQGLAKDEPLRAAIGDDLKRLDLLGAPLPLRFTTTQGGSFDMAEARGSVVIVAFFAVWSPPSVAALDSVREAIAKLPKDGVRVVGVSLDAKPEPLAALLRQKAITWPVAYDGQGWESPLVRGLGINALPTVWLADRQGRLRSLNGLEGMTSQVRQLLAER